MPAGPTTPNVARSSFNIKKTSEPETPATACQPGVPRRFGISTLLVITAMYAVPFAVLRTFGVRPSTFVVVAMFFTAVGLGQAILYKGQRPVRASMVAGACFFAGLSVVNMIVIGPLKAAPLPFAPFHPFEGAFGGAILGYLSGLLIAGVFVVIDNVEYPQGESEATEEADET